MIVLETNTKEFQISLISHCVDNTEKKKNSRKTKIMSVSDRVYNYECKTTDSRCLCILPFCFNRPSEQERSPFLKIELPNGFSSQHKIRHLYLTKHAPPLTFLHSLWWVDKEKRGYLLIQSSVSYVISNARECRRMYVSIDIYLLAHSFFEQRTVQLLNLWSESIFANSTHWLEMTHAPGFFEVSRLFDVRKSDS